MGNNVDGIMIEVMRNALQSIAEEMGASLIRTALSPNIKDRMDCSTAIYTKKGELIAQAEHIPLHLGLMPSVVQEVLKIYPPETLREGDAILINDPYISGSHLPDIFMISPVFFEEQLVAVVGNIAHHVDVGGMTPGSTSTTATEIFQEGLRIPGVRIRKEGIMDEELIRLFTTNIRAREGLGDLYAQLAANNVAESRLKELFARYGVDVVEKYMDEIINHSIRRMSAAIKEVPKGVYSYEDYLEGDGINNDLIKIVVNVTVGDDNVTVDFSGTGSAQGPINSTLGVTKACAYYVIKALFDPEIPPNAGAYKLIDVIAPLGSVVNAKYPAAVSNGNANTSQRIVDTILGALAPAVPEQSMAACSGSMNAMTIGGFDNNLGQFFSYVETTGGGQGATKGFDGMDGVHTNMTNTRNTPVEVIEQSYPLFIKQYALASDTGGSGKYRGGMGIIREIMIECDEALITIKTERREIAPWGLFGGKNGGTSKTFLTKGSTGEKVELPSKATLKVQRGDVIYMQTPGGGGYKSPSDRDPKAVENDLRLGNITLETVQKDYQNVVSNLK